THSSFFLYSYSLFFNHTLTTDFCTLSLHDALPISLWTRCTDPTCPSRSPGCPPTAPSRERRSRRPGWFFRGFLQDTRRCRDRGRSEEHTSELQSRVDLVCRLLLEKKKQQNTTNYRQ